MKLSVCIPVYNFDVRNLVKSLLHEISASSVDAEIIIIDDASEPRFDLLNRETEHQISHFIALEKNVGRSKIRNLFLNFAKGEYLLFLDCDVKICDKNFLKKYIKAIEENPYTDVFYGNFKIDQKFAGSLRNRYSVAREIFTEQESGDFRKLKTVNFVIKREAFFKFQFNEKLLQYGYEDYVFAEKLRKADVGFKAFQNPVIHVDSSANEDFLKKTQTAINSLIQLSQDPEYYPLIKEITIFKTGEMIEKIGFRNVFLLFFAVFKNKIQVNLLSERPSVRYFDLYRLWLFLKASL